MKDELITGEIQEKDLSRALEVALKATRLGKEVLLKYFGHLEHIEEKFQAGLVSEADKESEKVIISHLRKFFPETEVLGEESTAAGVQVKAGQGGAEGRWILDPLDGTTNYIHRFPIFCISLALEVKGEIVVAVVDVPMLGEVYTAVKGRGAYMNGKKISVSHPQSLKSSLLATGFFSENEKALQEQLKVFSTLVRCSRGIRRPGAAAYDLCLVARGVFDAFWERNLQPWDSAAGLLLVKEAGGIVKSYRGKEFIPYYNSIVAGSEFIVGEIHQKITTLIDDETD